MNLCDRPLEGTGPVGDGVLLSRLETVEPMTERVSW